eukprot:CAMPEP_0172520982 /NCGR_PEP_ID=MMETSP1066-20121228/292314_1 /TAXON_ID=671091 /ORGANISM="Coscinodiscus wailesii, Strain CCMP2513" /LENGTH=77 /DNA_ID=CAMNT_0013303813 /DNA_START=110 /DNA_END=343 /DNA_ORIENTATION=+
MLKSEESFDSEDKPPHQLKNMDYYDSSDEFVDAPPPVEAREEHNDGDAYDDEPPPLQPRDDICLGDDKSFDQWEAPL